MWYPIAQTLLLARMSWEDFTTRTINLWLFIAWGVVVAFGPHQDYRTVLLNGSITMAQVLVILLYTALKSKGKHLNLFHYIGLGDLLFMAIAAVHLPALLFQAGLVLALILSLIYGWLRGSSTQPLAGMFALVTLAAHWLLYSKVALFTQTQALWP